MNPSLQSNAAEWLELYNANVGSVVRLVTQLVPAMVERRWGCVIMLGSFLGVMPGPLVANYATTKVADIAQAVSLAKELGGTGTNLRVDGGMLPTTYSRLRRAAAIGSDPEHLYRYTSFCQQPAQGELH